MRVKSKGIRVVVLFAVAVAAAMPLVANTNPNGVCPHGLKYAHDKTLIDSRVGLAHKALDVAMSRSHDNLKKAETLDITLRVGNVDKDKNGSECDGGGGEPPVNGGVPPNYGPVSGNSDSSFGTPSTSSELPLW